MKIMVEISKREANEKQLEYDWQWFKSKPKRLLTSIGSFFIKVNRAKPIYFLGFQCKSIWSPITQPSWQHPYDYQNGYLLGKAGDGAGFVEVRSNWSTLALGGRLGEGVAPLVIGDLCMKQNLISVFFVVKTKYCIASSQK